MVNCAFPFTSVVSTAYTVVSASLMAQTKAPFIGIELFALDTFTVKLATPTWTIAGCVTISEHGVSVQIFISGSPIVV